MHRNSFHPSNRRHSAQAGFGSLAFWLAVWAIVISLICLYLGIDARNVANDAERRLQRNVELLDESRAKIAELETQVRESLTLSTEQLDRMKFTVERNSTRSETNATQLASTRKVASELITGLTSQKEAITELAMRIPAIPEGVQTERTPRPAPSGNQAATPSSTGGGTPAPNASPEGPPAAAKPPATYTVKSGDTLVDIARRMNFSVPDLLDANRNIDPNVIRVGQKLNLPE